VTTFFATLTGVCGGYIGAGSGVMMLALLGLGVDVEFRIINALKTLAVVAANVVATVIFVAAEIDWRAVGMLAAGSVIGGSSARGSADGYRRPCSAAWSSWSA
jgi:uncharacterized membrane protein YfcA